MNLRLFVSACSQPVWGVRESDELSAWIEGAETSLEVSAPFNFYKVLLCQVFVGGLIIE